MHFANYNKVNLDIRIYITERILTTHSSIMRTSDIVLQLPTAIMPLNSLNQTNNFKLLSMNLDNHTV